MVVGIGGAQGSGKSTVAQAIALQMAAAGLSTEVVSLDDLYLFKRRRRQLADTMHPLLSTRGPPGTHDPGLGVEIIQRLRSGAPVRMPRFDKIADDHDEWAARAAPVDIVLFEGWCVGARPQAPETLPIPVNDLEATEDLQGRWRGYVNTQLATSYAALFAEIDFQVLLRSPDFDVVYEWRAEQEVGNVAASAARGPALAGSNLRRFIQHYERISRHIAVEMPGRADLTLQLDRCRLGTGYSKSAPSTAEDQN